MPEIKMCPMKAIATAISQGPCQPDKNEKYDDVCCKERCAWWNQKNESCAVMSLGNWANVQLFGAF